MIKFFNMVTFSLHHLNFVSSSAGVQSLAKSAELTMSSTVNETLKSKKVASNKLQNEENDEAKSGNLSNFLKD